MRVEGVSGVKLEKAGRDPVLEWVSRPGGGVHRLYDRPPYHLRCRCQVVMAMARGEQWEVTKTIRSMRGPCGQCVTRERIWLWLTENGHRQVEVRRLAPWVDFRAFTRIYSHLKRLCERFPQALPEEGIWLTFDPSLSLGDFGTWDERRLTLNLSAEWFGNPAGLAGLQASLSGLELDGANPRGCNTPEYVVTHEFAHALYRRLDIGKYEAWWSTSLQRLVCRNALEGPAEGFAESFAMLVHTAQQQWPPAVRALRELLREDGVGV